MSTSQCRRRECMLPASLRCGQLQCPSQWPQQKAHRLQTEQCLAKMSAGGKVIAALNNGVLTNDNVCLGSSLSDDG